MAAVPPTPRLIPYAAAATAAAWVTRSYWWPGRYVVTFDGYTYAGPNLRVTEQAMADGRLALWNDRIFGGVTHLGNPQAGTLYPFRVVALFLEDNRALGVLAAAHVALLGLGMVALARRLAATVWAAAFVGVVSVLNGAVLHKSMQLEQILVIAWAPWLLVAIHAVLTTERPARAVAATAAVTAATLLAGHPQMVYETALLAAAAAIGFAVATARWRRLPMLAGGVGLGLLIAAPQVIAAAVATSRSAIVDGRDETSLVDPSLALVPGATARALLGTMADVHPAGWVGSFESVAFVGVIVVLLATIGVVRAVADPASRPWAITFGGTAALALVWSFGPRTPIFRLADDVLPGFDLARGSARWLILVVVVLCLFAGLGLDALTAGLRRAEVVAVAVVLVVGALIVGVRRLDGDDLGVIVEWVVLAGIAVGAIVVTVVVPRYRLAATIAIAVVAVFGLGVMSLHSTPQRSVSSTPFTSPSYRQATTDFLAGQAGYTVSFTDEPAGPDYLVPGLRPNANVLVDVDSIDGYDGGVQVTEQWADALRRLTPDPNTDLPLRNNVTLPIDPVTMGRLGVRFVLIDRDRPIAEMVPGWLGPRAVDDWFEVWENPAWVGEAIAWSSAQEIEPGAVPDLLRRRGDELVDVALVDELATPLSCDATACAPLAVGVEATEPEVMTLSVDLPRRAVVTVDQQYDPGWRVEIDGVPADVVEVDDLVVGVDVPAGSHALRWVYRPDWLTPALLTGLVATIVTVCLALPPPDRRRVRAPTR